MTNILIDVPVNAQKLEALCALPKVSIEVCDPISEDTTVRAKTLVADKDVVFCATPPENLDDMPKLQWVQVASSGVEHLVPFDLPGRGIRVSNARGVFDIPIAEWCVAMMVNLARDLPSMFRNQQAGQWDRDARFQTEIRGRTVGFWGYGGLARETARLSKTMGMHVHVLTRNGVRAQTDTYCVPETGDPLGKLPDEEFRYEKKAAFLAGLDYLVMGLPLNDQTRGIVSADDLRALPPTAFVVNPARGPLIEEAAFLEALREDWIAGAALDTHYQYPLPADHPLWSMPNVIMTPHVSGSTKSTCFPERVWDLFIQNVKRYVEGRTLLNEIDATALCRSGVAS